MSMEAMGCDMRNRFVVALVFTVPSVLWSMVGTELLGTELATPFEAAAMLATFVLLGHWLEMRACGGALGGRVGRRVDRDRPPGGRRNDLDHDEGDPRGVMAGNAIALVASICGVFVMQSALAGDRRLVIAGFRPIETVLARLGVLGAATVLVVAVAMSVTALNFEPESWLPFVTAAALIGVIYAGIGALAGAVLDRLAATYLMLFLALVDIGIVQNPMFGEGDPGPWAVLLPGYGPSRVMVDPDVELRGPSS